MVPPAFQKDIGLLMFYLNGDPIKRVHSESYYLYYMNGVMTILIVLYKDDA